MNFELSCVCVFVLGPVLYFAAIVIQTRGRVFFEGGESAMSTPIAVSLLILFLPLIILAALFYFSL